MKTAGNRKITHGYVEQIFDDEGRLVEQKFVAGDTVEWENHDGNLLPTIPQPEAYHPFDMIQPEGMTVMLVGNLSDGFGAVGPFTDFEEACRWGDSQEGWVVTLQSPHREFDDPKGDARAKYLRDNMTCPYCGSHDLATREVDEQLSAMYRPIRCEGCGKEWTETFTMTGVTFDG